jgi:hypothetical protein
LVRKILCGQTDFTVDDGKSQSLSTMMSNQPPAMHPIRGSEMKTLTLIAFALIVAAGVQAKGAVNCAKLYADIKSSNDLSKIYQSELDGMAAAMAGLLPEQKDSFFAWMKNPYEKLSESHDQGGMTDEQYAQIKNMLQADLFKVVMAQNAALKAAGCPMPK